MDFSLTDEQREIQTLTRDFAQAEIEPHAAEWDREHRFPTERYAKLAELGLMGVCVPEELEGAGADFVSYILVLEELSGSDAGSLRTAATPEGDGWRITGTKQWITNGTYAGTFLTFARTDPDTETARGVSAFILDREHVEVTREEEKLGLNSSSTVDLHIDAHVDADRLLHEERKGFAVAMTTLDGGRIGIAAQAVGIAQAAYDTARAYALERRQFGQRIADFQAIQWKLADMATEIDAARLLVYRAAWLKEQGRPHTAEGAKAKLFASEMARRQTAEAIQILGGYGYTKEFAVERD